INILPSPVLQEWQQKINSLQPCWNLTKEDLQQKPICPHCHFRPKDEKLNYNTSLESLDENLDELLNDWTESLIANLNDDEVRKSISLLNEDEKQIINELLDKGELTLPIDVKLIQNIKELFQGIEKVEVSISDLKETFANGSPLTINEVRNRFEQMLREQVGDSSSNRIRIMLQQ